jgi:hypothetical protein
MRPAYRRLPPPRRLRTAIAIVILLGLILPAGAQRNTSEVDALLQRLAESGCEFRRHGQWHSAAAASEHLRMKHRYMFGIRPGMTTEEFISAAASRSSATQQPYWVRCNGSAERTSAEWMTGQLKALRAASSP